MLTLAISHDSVSLVSASVDSPLYILPHSKTMLTLAISHDSQFLSSNLVMDYSLLVGVDDEKKELVVGIIGESKKHYGTCSN